METKTTETMNEVIARFMGGFEFYAGFIEHSPSLRNTAKPDIILPEYHKDWNELHRVWSNLRPILEEDWRKNDCFTAEDRARAVYNTDVRVAIKEAFYTSDITSAHKYMYESIQYLTNLNNR